MITSVMFDMGGTLEDIYVDERSEWAAIEKLDRMLREGGLDPQVDLTELKRRVDAGWKRYGAFRDSCDVELKPIPIWCDYVLADFGFPRDVLEPLCEPIAYMWELTHYHRSLRPRVREMLGGLRQLGLRPAEDRLGIRHPRPVRGRDPVLGDGAAQAAAGYFLGVHASAPRKTGGLCLCGRHRLPGYHRLEAGGFCLRHTDRLQAYLRKGLRRSPRV